MRIYGESGKLCAFAVKFIDGINDETIISFYTDMIFSTVIGITLKDDISLLQAFGHTGHGDSGRLRVGRAGNFQNWRRSEK